MVRGGAWLLLGHLCDVLVTQCNPQVIVLIQKHLLHSGLSNATCFVPAEEMVPV